MFLQNTHLRRLPLLLLLLAVILPAVPNPARADFQRDMNVGGHELTLLNLIGEVQLVGHDGDGFKIHVNVRGKDASEELIQIESEENQGRSRVVVLVKT